MKGSDYPNATPGELLSLIMRRRGWSAARLADLTSGAVSVSSIRAYASDRSRPRPHLALAVANAVGPEAGQTLLLKWRYPDLAEGFTDQWRDVTFSTEARLEHQIEATFKVNRIEYEGSPLSTDAIASIQHLIKHIQRPNGADTN